MKLIAILFVATVFCVGASSAQALFAPAQDGGYSIAIACAPPTQMPDDLSADPGAGDSSKKADPSYKLYKKGYTLVLDENWKEAETIMDEVVKEFPASDYVDDAAYWSAFAQKHIDKSKAKEAYKKFIRSYPNSNYYDDAVADYSDLNRKGYIAVRALPGGGSSMTYILDSKKKAPQVVQEGWGAAASESSIVKGYALGTAPFAYGYAFAPSMRQTERQLRLAERMQRQMVKPMSVARLQSMLRIPRSLSMDEEKLDPDVRLKMDAMYALGETKEDSISYKTLRDVAVDKSQPSELRMAAMDALSNFTKFDVFPVFLKVAREDTSEDIQEASIDYIGQMSKEKSRSVDALRELLYAIPKQRTSQRQAVLSSIAEIGNDAAVDVLARVAQTFDDYDMRSDAIYYLGNIGGDRARAALYEILRGK